MDLDETKEVCGTCEDWQGKRELGTDNIVKVKASARGICQRLSKPKPPHGGCDQWKRLGGEKDG